MANRDVRLLAGAVVILAAFQACAVKPTVTDTGEPIPLNSTDPRYSRYLGRVREMIKEKWFYPCVKNEATGKCEPKAAKVTIEFRLLGDGGIGEVTVTKNAEWPVYDDAAAAALRMAHLSRRCRLS